MGLLKWDGRMLALPNMSKLLATLGLTAGLVAGLTQGANAAELRISIEDFESGGALADVVVEVLLPTELQAVHTLIADYSVDQQQKEFVPNVSVISRGSRVNFPNSDDILHHVYSFSSANVFELPLYGNGQNIDYYEPFEQPGVVELGCNIHDWMLGYIYVAETSLATKTDATGEAVITGIPAGEFQVRIWHPRAVSASEALPHAQIQTLTFTDGEPARLRLALVLERDNRLRRAPDAGRTRYR
ncbi:MAG: methylamine utilization protein [Pseudomonadota bacterium]